MPAANEGLEARATPADDVAAEAAGEPPQASAAPAAAGWRERLRKAFSLRRNLRHLLIAPPGRVGPIDGLRALSIVWVVVFHAGFFARTTVAPEMWQQLLTAHWMLPLWRGDFGVDLFFVLSGFLIGGMLIDERASTGRIALGLFYVRRLLRLWPALLVAVVLRWFTFPIDRPLLWVNLLYANNFVPIVRMAMGWTWSLSIEEQFYVVCPLLLRALYPLWPWVRIALLGGLVVFLMGVTGLISRVNGLRPWDAEIVVNVTFGRWLHAFDLIYDKPWTRGGALLVGVIAALLVRRPGVMQALGQARVLGVLLALLALAAMGVATHWPLVVGASRHVELLYLASFRTVFAAGAAFLLLLSLSEHPLGRAMSRALSAAWLYPIAQLAYAAYLLNPMASMLSQALLKPLVEHHPNPMRFILPGDVVFTFAGAVLLHLLVERPFMELRPRGRP